MVTLRLQTISSVRPRHTLTVAALLRRWHPELRENLIDVLNDRDRRERLPWVVHHADLVDAELPKYVTLR